MSSIVSSVELGSKSVSLIASWRGNGKMVYGGKISKYPDPSRVTTDSEIADAGEGLIRVQVIATGATVGDGSKYFTDGYDQFVYAGTRIILPSRGQVEYGNSSQYVITGWQVQGGSLLSPGSSILVTSPLIITAAIRDISDGDATQFRKLQIGETYDSGNVSSKVVFGGAYSSGSYTITLSNSRGVQNTLSSRTGEYRADTSDYEVSLSKNSDGVTTFRINGTATTDDLYTLTATFHIHVSGHGISYDRTEDFKWYFYVVPSTSSSLPLCIDTKIYIGKNTSISTIPDAWKTLISGTSENGMWLTYRAPRGTALILPGEEEAYRGGANDGFTNTDGKWCAWAVNYNGVQGYFPLGFYYTVGSFSSDELIAYFRKENYVIVFDYNGGVVSNFSSYEQLAYIVAQDGLIQLNGANFATKEGYVLAGWRWANCPLDQSNNTEVFDKEVLFPPLFPFKMMQSYVVMSAVWVANTARVPVKFESTDLGVSDEYVVPITINGQNTKLAIPSEDFIKDGYYISRWSGSKHNINSSQLSPAKWFTLTASDTLIPSYERDKFSVVLLYSVESYPEWIKSTYINQTVDTVQSISTQVPNYHDGSKTFIGWAYTDADANMGIVTQKSGSSIKWQSVMRLMSYDASTNTWYLTLFATWADVLSPNEYELVYNPNDSVSYPARIYPGSVIQQKYNVSSVEFQVSTMVPVRDGWTFAGWADTPNATSPRYQPNSPIVVSDTDVFNGQFRIKVLYAVWTRFKFTLSLYSTSTILYQTLSSVYSPLTTASIRLPMTVPTYGNRVFMGWSSRSTDTTAQVTAGNRYSFTIAQKVMFEGSDEVILTNPNMVDTLYGVWVGKYTQVVYDMNGGTGGLLYDSSEQIATTVRFTIWDATKGFTDDLIPQRSGFTFKGWSKLSRTGTPEYQAGDRVDVDYNDVLYLYAVWEYNYVDHNAVVEYDIEGNVISIRG